MHVTSVRLPAPFASRGNAVAKSFFASLKREPEGTDGFESWEPASLLVGEYIDVFLNPCRRHLALNHISLTECELIHSVKTPAK
jgi:hypothetical protein